jgi:nitrite reductase (NO-forming)
MKNSIMLAVVLSAIFALNACKQNPSEASQSGNTESIAVQGNAEEAKLTSPPMVPEPIGNRAAKADCTSGNYRKNR